MKREIKFRFWNKTAKVMLNWDEAECYMFNNIPSDRPYFIQMQYTGLKDKNGKEIYEGDIVDYFDKYGKKPIAIKWDEDEANFNISKSSIKAFSLGIIGNIYENPDLIKDL